MQADPPAIFILQLNNCFFKIFIYTKITSMIMLLLMVTIVMQMKILIKIVIVILRNNYDVK